MTTIHPKYEWQEFGQDEVAQEALIKSLPEYLHRSRWFGGKAYSISNLRCDHCLPLDFGTNRYYFFVVEVAYHDHETEHYLIPISLIDAVQNDSQTALAFWKNEHTVLTDALYDKTFQQAIFTNVLNGSKTQTSLGTLVFDKGAALNGEQNYLSSRTPKIDQSNSCIFFNDKYFMKFYRKLFLDTNPEVDMLKYLTEHGGYKHIPAYRGSLIWERKKIAPVTFALMMNQVDARRDNWVTTGDELNDFLKAFVNGEFSIHEFVFEHVELLAKRTAEMHTALSKETDDKAFKAESFNPKYRAWLFDHLEHLLEGRLKMIENNRHKLDEEDLRMANLLSDKKETILKFFERIKKKPLKSMRTRIHGDYHLGQVLYTNNDFIIIDFEGEPESSIADRKIKHSPLKDVAGMIRSFHYAVSAKLFYSHETKNTDRARLEKAADRWFFLIRETFTEAYLEALGKDQKLYHNKAEINFLFLLHLLEKAIYEVGYELNGRPDWLKIPLKGIERVINELEKYQE